MVWRILQTALAYSAYFTLLTSVVERRSSEVLSTLLTDDGPVYHTLSVHLSQAKLIARSTIDMPRQNFLSPEIRKTVPEESTLIFVDTRIS